MPVVSVNWMASLDLRSWVAISTNGSGALERNENSSAELLTDKPPTRKKSLAIPDDGVQDVVVWHTTVPSGWTPWTTKVLEGFVLV